MDCTHPFLSKAVPCTAVIWSNQPRWMLDSVLSSSDGATLAQGEFAATTTGGGTVVSVVVVVATVVVAAAGACIKYRIYVHAIITQSDERQQLLLSHT